MYAHIRRPRPGWHYWNVYEHVRDVAVPLAQGYMDRSVVEISYRNKKRKMAPTGKRMMEDEGHHHTPRRRYKYEESVRGHVGGVYDESGSYHRLAHAKRFKKKGIRERPRGKVHVTKKFRAMVDKALEPGKIYGTADQIYLGGLLGIGGANTQNAVGDWAGLGTLCVNPWSFTLDYYLNLASVLFNNKTPTNAPSTSINPVAANNFNFTEIKFKVVRSWCKYKLKNMSNQSAIVKIYLCAPTRNAGYSDTTGSSYTSNVGGNTLTTDVECYNNPGYDWTLALLQDQSDGYLIGNVLTTELFWSPTTSKAMKKMYKMELTELVLEPGQEYEYSFNGPSQMEYDGQSHTIGNIWANVRKFSRVPLFIAIPNMNVEFATGPSSYANAGRYAPNNVAAASGKFPIIVERYEHCEIEMPEMTLSGAGGNRKSARFHHVYNVGDPGQVVYEREFEAPTAPSLF